MLATRNADGYNKLQPVPDRGSFTPAQRNVLPQHVRAFFTSPRERPMTQATPPIQPTTPPSIQQDLLERLLGTRGRDRAAIEAGHRELLAASPALHRKLIGYLAAHDPASPLL